MHACMAGWLNEQGWALGWGGLGYWALGWGGPLIDWHPGTVCAWLPTWAWGAFIRANKPGRHLV